MLLQKKADMTATEENYSRSTADDSDSKPTRCTFNSNQTNVATFER
jgi:hypothetical protein